MKNNLIISILMSLLLVVSLNSCDDALDVDRIGTITPEEMWDKAEYIEYYVNNFYNYFPTWNHQSDNTEEALSTTLASFLRGLNTSGDGYPDRYYTYSAVRAINKFFEEIDKATMNVTNDEKNYLKGQAHFFRAFVYYRMVRTLGGVPIIEEVLDPIADPLTLERPRNSTLECFNYIVSELDNAIGLLPPKGTDGYENARVTKAGAMAMKGEVLLLKASPLFCKTSNSTYWQEAYDALTRAKVELDKEGYGLFTSSAFNVTDLYWYDKENADKENILFIEYKYPEKTNTHQRAQRPLSTSASGAGFNQPTWEMVQAYPMINGKDITDQTSGYNPDQFWVNRDSRFYSTIVYNGASYGIGSIDRRQWIYSGVTDDGYQGNGYNNSGFYSRKGVDTTLNQAVFVQQALNWPVMRYAEVLLNLAECANEVDKGNEAVDHIIALRDRAHILPGADNRYGLSTNVGSDYEATLQAIMKERQIEFAYEGKRFWDLRRRRMFDVLNDYGIFHAYAPYVDFESVIAMNIGITSESDGVEEVVKALNKAIADPARTMSIDEIIEKATTFEVVRSDINEGAVINIPERNYFAPLDATWMTKNPKLKQNKGWDTGDFDPVIQ